MMRRCLGLSVWFAVTSALAQTPSMPFLIGADWREDASSAVKDLFWETECNFARVTGGGYDWAVEAHNRALNELDRHGVQVLLQLGSHYPSARFFDFKDAYFVDQNGKTGVPSRTSWAVEYDGQAWPQYSYASSLFRSELEKDFTAYFKALGPHRNIEALLLHNEPGYFWLDNRIFDYSPASIARFRAWLPSQYSSIAELNRRWGSAFDSFDAVEPPKLIPPLGKIASWMDWRRSNTVVIEDFLGWERTFARRVQPGLPATTNLAGPIDNWFPIRLADNYSFSQTMDIASIDIYPGAQWTSRFFPGYAMDMTRAAAAGKRVFVAECESYAQDHFKNLTDQQRADRLTSDLWSYIGHGANGILIWTWNGQDGFRLTNGEFNARVGAVRETAHTAKMLNLGEFVKPARKTALVVDPDSFLLAGDGHIAPRDWGSRMQGMAEGWYGALAEAHIETDVISTDMVRKGGADHYKALVLAGVETMDNGLARSLAEFVGKGGLVVADSTMATYDRWGSPSQIRPASGLDRLFGIQIQGDEPEQQLRLQGAESLARFKNGNPAITHRQTGKGHAILLAINGGVPNAELQSESLAGWLKTYAAISPDVDVVSPGGYVDATCLSDAKGNTLAVVTNPPSKSDPANPFRNVRVTMAKAVGETQSFLFEPALRSGGRTAAGPRIIEGSTWVVPTLFSHATILRARDHSSLIATDSPQVAVQGSQVKILATVFNPSPKPMVGTLLLHVPNGWSGGRHTAVKIGPFGQAKIELVATAGSPSKREVVKAVLQANGTQIESIPFDIEVR